MEDRWYGESVCVVWRENRYELGLAGGCYYAPRVTRLSSAEPKSGP